MRVKSNKFIKYIVVLLAFILFSSGTAFANWVGLESNYLIEIMKDVAAEPSVIKKDSGDTATNYFTVNKALEEAQSGDTIWLIPGKKHVLYKDATIKEGVSLYLPIFEGEDMYYTDMGEKSKYLNTSVIDTKKGFFSFINPGKYKKNDLILNEGVELTNHGKLFTYAKVFSQSGNLYSCSVNGDYAQITLNQNSKIENYGEIYNYGYITPNVKLTSSNEFSEITENNSVINNYSGSYYESLFTVTEHRGGNNFLSMTTGFINRKFVCTPFNRISMGNSLVKSNNYYGCKIYGFANLYAGSKNNLTKINIVGTTSDALLELGNKSLFTFKGRMNRIENQLISFYNLDFNGNFNLNPMSLNVKVFLTVTITITTKDVFFPISWQYNITLNSFQNGDKATFNTKQKVKFLPGSSIIINKNVDANFEEIAIYDQFNDQCTLDFMRYEAGKDPANFVINGGIVSGNTIAGTIKTEDSNSEVNIKKSVSLSIDEFNDKKVYQTISLQCKGKRNDAENSNPDGTANLEPGKYLSDGISRYASK